MVTKGWCENCQFQNINGLLYCSQCGEELNKPQRGTQIITVVLILIVVIGLILTFVWRPF